ncbi:hypothetical protein DFR31_2422 [Alkalispirillum mobile]|uniref:Uncharacterized protein n=1 Tax=Alkalispirillum mobile TaxID=85925 RepID=A0A498BT06_9GAMM|nr:hypothetical protein [Alkalispirillum mobile]RLK47104.1 hypothetical protein DFR31_2422 [Alkalispirillum mobile]
MPTLIPRLYGRLGVPLITLALLSAAGATHALDPEANQSHLSPDTLATAVNTDTLGEQRARQGVTNLQLGQALSTIELRDNQVIGGHSGQNIIGAGAFGDASGVFSVIQNSGHNVAIQESMVINISVNP